MVSPAQEGEKRRETDILQIDSHILTRARLGSDGEVSPAEAVGDAGEDLGHLARGGGVEHVAHAAPCQYVIYHKSSIAQRNNV